MWSPPPLISKNFLSSRRARFSNQKFLKDRIIPCANRCRLSSGMNQFPIDSEFGVFQADGSEMLLQRVKEIYTIAKLKECFTDGIRGTQARAGCNIRPD